MIPPFDIFKVDSKALGLPIKFHVDAPPTDIQFAQTPYSRQFDEWHAAVSSRPHYMQSMPN
jgi:hypothetical protein